MNTDSLAAHIPIIQREIAQWLASHRYSEASVEAICAGIAYLPQNTLCIAIGGTTSFILTDEGAVISLPTPTLGSVADLGIFIIQNIPSGITQVLLSFAFALDTAGQLDGVLMHGGKGHTLSDMVAKPVGASISHWLHTHFNLDITVSVLNDQSVQALAYHQMSQTHAFFSGVVGTGLNLCVVRNAQLIGLEPVAIRVSHPFEVSQAVSLEELVSGYSLHHLYNALVDPASAVSNTSRLSQVVLNQGKNASVAADVIAFSADVFATLVVSVAEHFAVHTNLVCMEGSVFWHLPGYAARVRGRISQNFGQAVTIDRALTQIEALQLLLRHASN